MALITLTFDNGPTPGVLLALGAASVRAHFFVLGKHLATDEGRSLLRQILAAGHPVGNHSFNHETPLGDDLGNDDGAASVQRELEATRLLLEPSLPADDLPRRFRPFGGGGILGPHLLSAAAVQWLSAHQHSCVLWNCVPGDWRDPTGWVDVALAEIANLPHAVVVLHDIPGACLPGLPRFLEAALASGHRFVDTFPASCLPIMAGVPRTDLTSLVRRRALTDGAAATAGVAS
jgi:peptidoglycan/xylan/chitin deacetylase (PgdA/CDA1 family)